MSENAWVGGADEGTGEPGPVRRPRALSLESHIERQEQEMAADGRTMADWLARMHDLDWGTVDSDAMIGDIRDWRDREAG